MKHYAAGRGSGSPISTLFTALALMLLGACSNGNGNGNGGGSQPFAEIFEQGVTRYMGMYTPMASTETDGVFVHTFGAGDGPLCQLGETYAMATRDQGSQDLIIFLEGGGACWSEFCLSTTEAVRGISTAGIMDTQRENNPAKDWNQVYVPYCDGSLHAGDQDIDTDDDGQNDRFQRGLHNLSAALDVAANTFSAPRRIVLAGNSGGGFGTIFALPLVRYAYPDARIDVINDSGVGVGRPGKPEFLQMLIDEWNLNAFIPNSCDDCVGADGHLTQYLIWQMDQDTTIKRAMLSYSQDTVLADTFLQIGGPAFQAALVPEMQRQEDAHPGRTRYWIPAGTAHTFVQLEPDQTAGGLPLMAWIRDMLNDSSEWVSAQDTLN